MRSLLLSRLARLCLRRQPPPLVVRHLGGARFLSETPLCHIVGAEHCGTTSRDGDVGHLVICDVGHLVICDYTKPSSPIKFLEKKVPMDLMKESGSIGASYGWVATLKDGVVCLHDLNPWESDSDDPKRISLPPLVTLPHCQTQLVTNVAMSSSSPEDDDCILAVKFVGPQLSLCRPARKDKSEWVNITIADQGLFSSRVIYSKRDEMFSMLASGGTHTGSWDLGKHMHKPKVRRWPFADLPEYVQSELQQLDSCCTTEHLVESRSTGEIFMVKSFRKRNVHIAGGMQSMHIMVFKLDENKKCALFTRNIGDLCIFLSKSEPFCLQASLYRQCENSVYYIENNEFGKVNLTYNEEERLFKNYPAPYYIPPQSQ